MFKIIKSLIVLCMVVGVIILGARIHQKSTELDKQMDIKHDQVKDKITDIKKDVLSRTKDLGKVYEHVQEKLDTVLEPGKTETEKDHTRDGEIAGRKLGSQNEAVKNHVKIDPIDEEDRALTEEILGEETEKNDQTDFTWEMGEKPAMEINEKIPLQITLLEEEQVTPMDLNKASEIRELYLKAVETLDFK